MPKSVKIITRKKIWLSFVAILILAVFCGLLVYPNLPDGTPGKAFFAKFYPHLGLDLQGGTHLVYQADLSQVAGNDQDSALQGVRDVIERRVNTFGVSEPVVQTQAGQRLIVELAGISDVNQAIKQIGETPLLEFKEIDTAKIDQTSDAEQTVEWLNTQLSGKNLKKAQVEFDPNSGQPTVLLTFDSDGKDLFADITRRNVGQPVAIFLDGIPISVPTVEEEIAQGTAVISGNFNINEAKLLAQRLNAGALPVPIELISQQTVGPALGKLSLQKSLMAGLIGLVAVILFMIFYYRIMGLVAILALFIYGLVSLTIFESWPVTLTLSGIAGFILSIGMAVDANVLIFERTKEELKNGKPLATSIEEGFKRAWPSIRDSNISSIITCVILFWFGSSIIKGFAITLGIGIIISMFSAITVSRNFLRVINGGFFNKHLGLFGIKIKSSDKESK